VLLQRDNLRTYPCVADRERTGGLSIHAWLYDLHTGAISEFREPSGTWENVALAS
jgi:carbonic anhydrase